jgi:hypothetical protein
MQPAAVSCMMTGKLWPGGRYAFFPRTFYSALFLGPLNDEHVLFSNNRCRMKQDMTRSGMGNQDDQLSAIVPWAVGSVL